MPWYAIEHPDGWSVQNEPRGGGSLVARLKSEKEARLVARSFDALEDALFALDSNAAARPGAFHAAREQARRVLLEANQTEGEFDRQMKKLATEQDREEG